MVLKDVVTFVGACRASLVVLRGMRSWERGGAQESLDAHESRLPEVLLFRVRYLAREGPKSIPHLLRHTELDTSLGF
jgi:hypothetical protein